MTSIETVVIVVLMIVTVSLLSVVSYSRKVKKEAALALIRENAQKEKEEKDRLQQEEEAKHARLARLQEKEKIKQWWANPISTTTDTTVVSAQPTVASYNSMRTQSHPVYDNGSNDLLTTLVVADLLTSTRHTVSDSVESNDYSPSRPETKVDTYSAPEPERSSYSSSYSSSDSDSSYSSSSSDSSYSSSSSD
jgi:Tfp pilus assembly protein PilE